MLADVIFLALLHLGLTLAGASFNTPFTLLAPPPCLSTPLWTHPAQSSHQVVLIRSKPQLTTQSTQLQLGKAILQSKPCHRNGARPTHPHTCNCCCQASQAAALALTSLTNNPTKHAAKPLSKPCQEPILLMGAPTVDIVSQCIQLHWEPTLPPVHPK